MAIIRALQSAGGTLYSVAGNRLIAIDSDGTPDIVGTLNSSGGQVDCQETLGQLVVNDGSFLYVYTAATDTFTTATNYPGGDRIAFIDQRIVFLYRGTQQFGWTNLGDPTTIDPLSFASAERSPDALVSIATANGEIWLFGGESTEVWQPTGTETVFERQPAAGIEYGCSAAFSVQNLANSLAWLGRDKNGQAMVLRANGYQPQRISTRAIEERFEGIDISSASAFVYSDGGQQFYCLRIPNVDTTLVWDDTFQEWHERAEWTNGTYQPWRATNHAFAYSRHFFGTDAGDIYELDRANSKYGDDVKLRDRIAPVISKDNREEVRFSQFEIVCETATTGEVMLRYSDDNGANWSNWRTESAGSIGEYSRMIRFNRLGQARDRVFQVRMTDDAPFNPVMVHIGAK